MPAPRQGRDKGGDQESGQQREADRSEGQGRADRRARRHERAGAARLGVKQEAGGCSNQQRGVEAVAQHIRKACGVGQPQRDDQGCRGGDEVLGAQRDPDGEQPHCGDIAAELHRRQMSEIVKQQTIGREERGISVRAHRRKVEVARRVAREPRGIGQTASEPEKTENGEGAERGDVTDRHPHAEIADFRTLSSRFVGHPAKATVPIFALAMPAPAASCARSLRDKRLRLSSQAKNSRPSRASMLR